MKSRGGSLQKLGIDKKNQTTTNTTGMKVLGDYSEK